MLERKKKGEWIIIQKKEETDKTETTESNNVKRRVITQRSTRWQELSARVREQWRQRLEFEYEDVVRMFRNYLERALFRSVIEQLLRNEESVNED